MLFSILKDLRSGALRPDPKPDLVPPPKQTSTTNQFPRLEYLRGGAIVAFVAGSEGDALKEHTLEMLKPIRPHCAEVVLIDFRNPDWQRDFDAAACRPIWFAVSPFGGGELFNTAAGGATSPWASSGIPFVRLYGDLPAYFPVRHAQHFPNSVNAYGHAEHQDFFVRWLEPKAPTVWLPLFPFDVVSKDSINFAAKANSGLVVFPKNGNSPNTLVDYWRASLPRAMATALEVVAEEATSRIDMTVDLAEMIREYFVRLSVDLSGQKQLLLFLVAQLDDYLRRVKSTMIARALLDLPVTIRGVNWEHIDFKGRRARHDPDSNYARTRSLLDESIAIVDMSPNTERGPHDRVLRAAGRYTAFLTNRSRFFTDNFSDADAFMFRFETDSIRDRVDLALSRPGDMVAVGVEQANRMRELLTEDRYVEQVIAAVDACAMGCGSRPKGTQNYVSFERIA